MFYLSEASFQPHTYKLIVECCDKQHRFSILIAGSIVILCRNPTLNPADFFDRTFEEYKNGFAANGICRKRTRQAFSNDDSITGEGWLGLEKMHQITSKKMYRLKITLTARNWTEYVGYYDWMKVGWGFRNCFWLFTERQQLLIILTRSRKEKRIDSELVSSLPATPPLETRSALTLALDGRLVTQEPPTWASQPSETRDQRTWWSSTSSSGTWTRTRTTRRTVRTQRLSIPAPTGGDKIQGVFFNWASPEFAKCWPVSNWFKKNVRVSDWPPLIFLGSEIIFTTPDT